jgi:DNA-binding CsgD family transcriptional regulator
MPLEYPGSTVHDLIQRIYLAATDASRWPAFLETLREQIDATSAVFAFLDKTNGGADVNAVAGLSPDVVRLYHERYAALDPFANGVGAIGPLQPGFIGLAQELISDEELERTEYYEQFGSKYGCIGGIICVVYADGPLVAIIGANRQRGRFFGPGEVSLFRTLFPHLRTGMQIHRELLAKAQFGRAAIATLNRLRYPAFICDENSTVLHMNHAAHAFAPQFVAGGRIARSSARESTKLRQAIAAAAGTASYPPGQDIVVPLGSTPDTRTTAIVCPLHQQEQVTLIRPMVALLVNTGLGLSEKDIDAVSRMYGLTRGEAKLTLALVTGHSLKQIAECLSISYETARTHLKRILAKTGTHRQAELVRLLLTSSLCA